MPTVKRTLSYGFNPSDGFVNNLNMNVLVLVFFIDEHASLNGRRVCYYEVVQRGEIDILHFSGLLLLHRFCISIACSPV